MDYTIIQDSREQKPLFIKDVVVKCLKTGDYSVEYNGIDYSDKIALERKSAIDLFGTLTKGHARFKKELERARELEYFAIVIDGSINNIYTKNFVGAKYTRIQGYVIAKILFTLHIKYGINIFFGENRNGSKRIIKGIFEAYLKQKEQK